MNKERLGDFIGSERKNLGLTQRDLAARLHVTDKAVSKWERGLSYPDVTLLEPLAAALDLTVEELMACRRQAAKGAEETMQSLLDISRDSVRQERRRSWQRLAAVLVLLAVTAAVVAYTQIVVTEEGYYSIVLKETVNGRNCVYVEDRGHLIRLKCGEDVDFDALTLRDERGDTISYQMDFQWNRLTRTGTVSACEDTGVTVLGGVMDVTYEGDSGSVPLLFGDTSVQYLRDGYYPDPYAESENLVFLCDVRFWPYHPEEPDPTGINTRAILEVEDCINAEALDVDGDGELEVASAPAGRRSRTPSTTMWMERLWSHGRTPCRRRFWNRCGPRGKGYERCCLWNLLRPPLRAAGGVSFRPEAGSQHLAFHSRERFLRCIDQYTARQYRHQSVQKEALAFARTSSCTSKTVSRVLYQTVIYLDVPSPVRSSHPGSGRASLGGRTPCSHTGVAPDRVYSIGQSPADG